MKWKGEGRRTVGLFEKGQDRCTKKENGKLKRRKTEKESAEMMYLFCVHEKRESRTETLITLGRKEERDSRHVDRSETSYGQGGDENESKKNTRKRSLGLGGKSD